MKPAWPRLTCPAKPISRFKPSAASEYEHQRRDAVIVGGWKEQRQQDDDGGHHHEARQPVLQQRAHTHTRSTEALPSSPRGMANSTIRITRNATASLYCEER